MLDNLICGDNTGVPVYDGCDFQLQPLDFYCANVKACLTDVYPYLSSDDGSVVISNGLSLDPVSVNNLITTTLVGTDLTVGNTTYNIDGLLDGWNFNIFSGSSSTNIAIGDILTIVGLDGMSFLVPGPQGVSVSFPVAPIPFFIPGRDEGVPGDSNTPSTYKPFNDILVLTWDDCLKQAYWAIPQCCVQTLSYSCQGKKLTLTDGNQVDLSCITNQTLGFDGTNIIMLPENQPIDISLISTDQQKLFFEPCSFTLSIDGLTNRERLTYNIISSITLSQPQVWNCANVMYCMGVPETPLQVSPVAPLIYQPGRTPGPGEGPENRPVIPDPTWVAPIPVTPWEIPYRGRPECNGQPSCCGPDPVAPSCCESIIDQTINQRQETINFLNYQIDILNQQVNVLSTAVAKRKYRAVRWLENDCVFNQAFNGTPDYLGGTFNNISWQLATCFTNYDGRERGPIDLTPYGGPLVPAETTDGSAGQAGSLRIPKDGLYEVFFKGNVTVNRGVHAFRLVVFRIPADLTVPIEERLILDMKMSGDPGTGTSSLNNPLHRLDKQYNFGEQNIVRLEEGDLLIAGIRIDANTSWPLTDPTDIYNLNVGISCSGDGSCSLSNTTVTLPYQFGSILPAMETLVGTGSGNLVTGANHGRVTLQSRGLRTGFPGATAGLFWPRAGSVFGFHYIAKEQS